MQAAAAGAAAHDYLHLLGHALYAWMWFKAARAAHRGLSGNGPAGKEFYQAKLIVGRHFLERQLPRSESLERQIAAGPEGLMALDRFLF